MATTDRTSFIFMLVITLATSLTAFFYYKENEELKADLVQKKDEMERQRVELFEAEFKQNAYLKLAGRIAHQRDSVMLILEKKVHR